jgi:hypothetical protein
MDEYLSFSVQEALDSASNHPTKAKIIITKEKVSVPKVSNFSLLPD